MRQWLLALGLCGLAMTAPAVHAQITGHDGWIREAPPSAPVRAGYVELRHAGGDAVTLVAARSPAFGAIEIHTMAAGDDGVMRMRRQRELVIHGGASVSLQPGGLHLMLFRPQRAIAVGDSVDVTLVAEDGREHVVVLEQR